MHILRVLAGIVLGYVASVALSLAWFATTRHSSILPASVGYMALTAAWCVVQGLGTGWLAAVIGHSRISSFGVAALVVVFSVLAFVVSHQARPVWSIVVAALVLAPCTACGGMLTPNVFRPKGAV